MQAFTNCVYNLNLKTTFYIINALFRKMVQTIFYMEKFVLLCPTELVKY